jgi:hypothetical protein
MATFPNNNKSIQLFRVQLNLFILPSLLQCKRFFLISYYLLQILLLFVALTTLVACWESSSAYQDPNPSPPRGLIARAVSSDQIDLSWTESTDDSGTPAYRIFRNDSFLQNVNGTNFSDTGLNPETQYCYRVYAYDYDGNISEASDEACTVSSWIISNMNIGFGYGGSIAIDSYGRVIYGVSCGTDGYSNYRIATKTQDTWIVEQLHIAGMGCSSSNSMAIDSVDKAHIGYNGGGYLSYATNSSGTWETEIIDNTLYPRYTSIAVDSADYIHISCNSGFEEDIKYATNASGNWITEVLENSNPIGQSPIAVDLNGNVHISFISYGSNDDNLLRYITNVSGTWSTDTVALGSLDPYKCSIAVDSAGNVNIIYRDYDLYDLKHATNSSGVWVSETVDDFVTGGDQYLSLVVDSYGNSHVSYFDYISDRARLNYANNVSGAWENYIIDNVGVRQDTASIAIDADDKVHIIYTYYAGLRYVTNR